VLAAAAACVIAGRHTDENGLGVGVDDVLKRGRIHEKLPIVLMRRKVERDALRGAAFSHRVCRACCHDIASQSMTKVASAIRPIESHYSIS
jgi:hypothetical protein